MLLIFEVCAQAHAYAQHLFFTLTFCLNYEARCLHFISFFFIRYLHSKVCYTIHLLTMKKKKTVSLASIRTLLEIPGESKWAFAHFALTQADPHSVVYRPERI